MTGMSTTQQSWSTQWKTRIEHWMLDAMPGEALDGPLARYFRARQVLALLSIMPFVSVGNAINTVVICSVFWDSLPHVWLVVWGLTVSLTLPIAIFWWRQLITSGHRPVAMPGATRTLVAHVIALSLIHI